MPDTDIKINEKLFERIERKKRLLDERRPLPDDAVKRLHCEMRLFHTYHSDAIEGNTLSLKETKIIIEQGITVGGKSLIEHLEAMGNAEAFDLVERLVLAKQPIDHVNIRKIHEMVTRGQLVDSGKYRTQNVRIAGAISSPPTFFKIPELMEDYIVCIKEMDWHSITMAAFIHHRFVQIHPFIDGNGRVARLLTNMYLMGHGYPPVILKKEERMKYYTNLQDADKGDLAPLVQFIAREVDKSLSLYLSIFGGKDELIPLNEIATNSRYSQEYLSLRARQGVLDAIKQGNVWHTTKRALEEYLQLHGKSSK